MTNLKTLRIPIMMTTDEVARIDDWRRHQPDLPSRSEAVRRLVSAGLGVEPDATPAPQVEEFTRFKRMAGRPPAIPAVQNVHKDQVIAKAIEGLEYTTIAYVCEATTGHTIDVVKTGTPTFDPRDRSTIVANPHVEKGIANSLLRLGWIEARDTERDTMVWVPRKTVGL